MSVPVPSAAVPSARSRFSQPDWAMALAALVLAWVATTALFWDTAVGMATIWYRSETFNHCFVVPPIALWLAWRRRAELRLLSPRPAPIFLLGVAAMALLWLLGDLVAVNAATQFALVALWVLAVPLLLGRQVAWVLLFPLVFMFFSVPLGEFLMPQLMESTADFTVAALRFSGVPVHREGLQFVIPSGNWSVVEACSGVRYLIASLMVGTLFANLNYQSTSRRVLFMLVALVVPVLANWLRAYMIVMLGHLSGNRLAVGVDHLIYGWVFFGVVILLMFMIGARWSEPDPVPPAIQGGTAAGTAAPWGGLAATWLALLVLVALPDAAKWGLAHSQHRGQPVLVLPATLSEPWQKEDNNPLHFTPAFRNAAADANPAYRGDGAVVGVYIGYYRNQNYQHKLVSSDNVVVRSGDPSWTRVRAADRTVDVGGRPLAVRQTELRRRGSALDQSERLMAWQLYWINGHWTTNDYLAKILSAWTRLRGEGDESAVVVLYAAHDAAGDGDNPPLRAFLAANLGKIESLLAQARATP